MIRPYRILGSSGRQRHPRRTRDDRKRPPIGPPIAVTWNGELGLASAVGVHHEDLVVPGPDAAENDLRAFVWPGGFLVDFPSVVCDVCLSYVVIVHELDLGS